MSATEAVPATTAPARRSRRSRRAVIFPLVLVTALALLFGVPWVTLVLTGGWPAPVVAAGTAVFVAAVVAFPLMMVAGHGRRRNDRAAVTGDTLLGVIWILFTWSVLGNVARLVLALAGVDDPVRSRSVTLGVLAVSAVLAVWGWREAMRVPRIRRVDVAIDRIGAGLDGATVAL